MSAPRTMTIAGAAIAALILLAVYASSPPSTDATRPTDAGTSSDSAATPCVGDLAVGDYTGAVHLTGDKGRTTGTIDIVADLSLAADGQVTGHLEVEINITDSNGIVPPLRIVSSHELSGTTATPVETLLVKTANGQDVTSQVTEPTRPMPPMSGRCATGELDWNLDPLVQESVDQTTGLVIQGDTTLHTTTGE